MHVPVACSRFVSILSLALFTLAVPSAFTAAQPGHLQESASNPGSSKAASKLGRVAAVSPGARAQRERAKNIFQVPDGTNLLFLPPMMYVVNYYTRTVAIADLNNDGKLDLVVNVSPCQYIEACGGLGDGQSGVQVLLGNGDGTFQQPELYYTAGYGSTSVAVSDVNHDGKPDLIATSECDFSLDCSSGVVSVFLGNGDGTFRTAVPYPSGGELATSVAVADVNGDGHADLLVTNCLSSGNSGSGCGEGSVAVLLGNGDGTFRPASAHDSGGVRTAWIAVADLNGDGYPDLVVASQYCSGCNSNNPDGAIGVLLGKGDGTFQNVVDYGDGAIDALSVSVADVNGDGRPDLLVANTYAENYAPGDSVLSVLLGNGDGTFKAPVTYDSGGGGAEDVIAADVNGDGHLDLIAANICLTANNCDNSGIGVLLGNGDGTFQSPLTFDSGAYGSMSVAAADMNGDGRTDIATAQWWYNVNVLLNDSGPHTPSTTTVVSSTNPQLRNENVTYTATVTSQSGHAIGAITFYDGSAALGTVALSNSQATFTTSYPKIGTHTITAAYPGDTANLGSTSAALIEDISSVRVLSKTAISTSGSPSYVGQPVTFTAVVTWAYGTIPNGEPVTFYDGTTPVATEATSNGTATWATSSLSVKTHNIRAAYAGDSTLQSSSATVQQVVSLFPTTIILQSSLNPSNFGQAVALTARVTTTGSSTPTGTVVFKNGTVSLGSASLNAAGTATFTSSKIPVGSNSLTATYNGDALNGKSTSTSLLQQVNQAVIKITLTSSPNPSLLGKAVKFTATLTSNGGIPTGTGNIVTFASAGTTLGTAKFGLSGVAIFSTSSLPSGSDTVTATYVGNQDFSSATASLTQVVQ